jgi:hypothetical protein
LPFTWFFAWYVPAFSLVTFLKPELLLDDGTSSNPSAAAAALELDLDPLPVFVMGELP